MLMELEGFASDWKFVASFIEFKISCYDQRECPAFENREGWGSQSSYAMQKSKVGQPPRYNTSSMGRFMTPDAFFKDSHAGDPQSWNEYTYVRNNPLRYMDPNGEKADVSTECTTDFQGFKTCNVSVTASIVIYAASGSLTDAQLSQAAATMQRSIDNAWTGSFTEGDVTVNVS
jgi:RHS repeat-associated protein